MLIIRRILFAACFAIMLGSAFQSYEIKNAYMDLPKLADAAKNRVIPRNVAPRNTPSQIVFLTEEEDHLLNWLYGLLFVSLIGMLMLSFSINHKGKKHVQ